ncbi:hypothetical protein I4J89_14160 [Actinoplanes sp. NEAU-A11]|uniref:Uncharacterized protein n=2 Tax=Actinoplanes aureus TaxID=2792083 RepID=A0A931C8D4_9ACTN|nr:hypothetical protein [Actinoplanes aureus]
MHIRLGELLAVALLHVLAGLGTVSRDLFIAKAAEHDGPEPVAFPPHFTATDVYGQVAETGSACRPGRLEQRHTAAGVQGRIGRPFAAVLECKRRSDAAFNNVPIAHATPTGSRAQTPRGGIVAL